MKKLSLRSKRIVALVMAGLLILSTVALAAGCKPKTIKIGAIGPFTGNLAKIGLDSYKAVQMAVDEFNAAGGVGGVKVELVMGDDQANPAETKKVAERFIADKNLVGVIGPMNTSSVDAILKDMEKAHLVMVSQSATNPRLTEQGYTTFLRVCPRDDDQAPAAAKFIVDELKVKTAYILDDKGGYGVGLADEVVKNLKALGLGDKDIKRGQITPDDKDFSAVLTNVKAAKPDLLYLAIANPAQAATMLKQFQGMGMKDLNIKVMGGDGIREKDELIKGAGGAAEGVYATSVGPLLEKVPEAQTFLKAFTAKNGSISLYSGQSYEATKILLAAIKKVGKTGGNVAALRQEVLGAVRATKDYKGILGVPISFNSKGDLVNAGIFVVQVKGDDFVQLKAIDIKK